MEIFERLWPDHLIRILMEEHQVMLDNLARLRSLNFEIQAMEDFESAKPEVAILGVIAANLLGAEPHHQREENVLFPQLEELGIEGPPAVMRQEHVVLRQLKRELQELIKKAGVMDFAEFKTHLNITANNLAGMLESHIEKENRILYPCALNEITDEQTWQTMKAACDEIGYCEFASI